MNGSISDTLFTRRGQRLFVVMLLSLAGVIGCIVSAVKITQESGWSKAQASVEKVFIDNVRGEFGALNVEYRYAVDGKPHSVTELVRSDNVSKLEKLKADFEKKGTVNICLNSANADDARINNVSDAKLIAAFMVCSLLCGLGFVGSARLLFVQKPG